MPGVTHELMLAGVSVSRNEKLAQVFNRLNIIEAFGTGIPRIYGAYENSGAQPEIPITDGGFLIRVPNMNYNIQQNGNENGKTVETNEQKILAFFTDTTFNKEEAAEVLGLSVSGVYKLLQRMVEQGILKARKSGKQWTYGSAASKIRVIETSDRLKGRIVAFVGTFGGGSIELKDLVYAAGGAPSDTVPVFTDYLVVGRNGEEASAYKKVSYYIKSGWIIKLTEDELRDICAGKMSAREPNREPAPGVEVFYASEEHEMEDEMQQQEVFEYKRAAFVKKYGILQPDGTRNKR